MNSLPIITFFALAGLPMIGISQEADPVQRITKSAETLFKAGLASNQPPSSQAISSALALRTELASQLEEGKKNMLTPALFNAITASFILSNATEWKNFAQGDAGLKTWLSLLEQRVSEPDKISNLAIRLAERHVSRWIAQYPLEASSTIEEVSATYARTASEDVRRQWDFYRVGFELQLGRKLDSSPERLQLRLQQFIENEGVSLQNRISMVANMARELYALGEAKRADQCLSEFASKNPRALTSINYRHAWFYVALFGLGDRAKARELLNDLEATGVETLRPKQNDPAFAMWDAYYRVLPLTDEDLRRQATAKMALIKSSKKK